MREDAQNIQFTSLVWQGLEPSQSGDSCHFLWIFLPINKLSLHTAKREAFSDDLGITNVQTIIIAKTLIRPLSKECDYPDLLEM